MASQDRGLKILFFVGVMGLCAGTLRAYAEKSHTAQPASRGPAATRDPRAANAFRVSNAWEHGELGGALRRPASPDSKGSARSRWVNNWQVSNTVKSEELKTHGNYQSRAAAHRGKDVAPQMSKQIFPGSIDTR